MTHVSPELMQRFLAGEVDLMLRETICEHLVRCDACSDLMVQVSAEDDALTEALRLDEADQAWVARMDLTVPVLQRLIPWHQRPALYLPALLAITAAAFALNVTLSLVTQSLTAEPIGHIVGALQGLIPALWRLNRYLAGGGLLTTMGPALLLAAAVWLWRSRLMKKEAHT